MLRLFNRVGMLSLVNVLIIISIQVVEMYLFSWRYTLYVNDSAGFFLEILLNQPEIRLYLPFSDWFRIKRTSVWFQINRTMENTIWFRFDLIRFGKDFPVLESRDRTVNNITSDLMSWTPHGVGQRISIGVVITCVMWDCTQ